MSLLQYTPAYSASYTQARYVFPPWVQAMGWSMALLPIVAIFAEAAHQCWKLRNNTPVNLWTLMQSSRKWCSQEQAGADRKAGTL